MQKIGFGTLTYLFTFLPEEFDMDEENYNEEEFFMAVDAKVANIAEVIKKELGYECDDIEVCISDYPKKDLAENQMELEGEAE